MNSLWHGRIAALAIVLIGTGLGLADVGLLAPGASSGSLIGKRPPPLRVGEWIRGAPMTGFDEGRVYVVDFWATWCGPCRAAIPHLTRLAEKYDGRIEVIGISISEKQDHPGATNHYATVRDFVRRMGDRMNYRVAADSGDREMYRTWFQPAGTAGIPTAYIIDGKGRVAWVGIGTPQVVERIAVEVLDGTFDPVKEAERERASESQARQRIEADRVTAQPQAESLDQKQPGYRVAMERGDTAAALASLDAAFAANPQLEVTGGYQRKLMVLLQRNQRAEVEGYARDLLKRFPDNDDVIGFVSACLVSTADAVRFDPKLALEAARKTAAVAKPGSRWQAFTRWRLGWALHHTGHTEEGVREIREARDLIRHLKGTIDFGDLDDLCVEALEAMKTATPAAR